MRWPTVVQPPQLTLGADWCSLTPRLWFSLCAQGYHEPALGVDWCALTPRLWFSPCLCACKVATNPLFAKRDELMEVLSEAYFTFIDLLEFKVRKKSLCFRAFVLCFT